MLPHLAGSPWLQANQRNFLRSEPYDPLPPDDGTALLLAAGIDADWDIPYERLAMPVAVISGLQDRVFYQASDVAELCSRLPDALVIELGDAGHLVTMERPDVVIDACLALAGRVS